MRPLFVCSEWPENKVKHVAEAVAYGGTWAERSSYYNLQFVTMWWTDLTVNEQNPQAIGFYQHLGFQTVARSATDDQGQPYPILRMRRLGHKFEHTVTPQR